MRLGNLTIIGTSHIAKQSLQEVEETIGKLRPAIVAVELDRPRAQALLKGERGSLKLSDMRRVGVKGFLFAWLGAYAERKLGELVGMKPGEEMLKAMQLAQQTLARVALVDQDISITLRRFSETLTWREKARIAIDVVKGAIFKTGMIGFDLTTVPKKELIKKLTDQLKKRYPNIYLVLIAERNEVIAHRLIHLMREFPEDQIMAVIGAGHVEGVVEIIKSKSQISKKALKAPDA